MSDTDFSPLRKLIAGHEDWLIRRILHYARERGYTLYTSTLAEAWRASICGLSTPILAALDRGQTALELDPEADQADDPIAAFGILEARRHRSRGITLQLFLGLMKYYRQAYQDLIVEKGRVGTPNTMSDKEAGPAAENGAVQAYHLFINRFFDRVELGFCVTWASQSEDAKLSELQATNRDLTNEKNRYLTIFESVDTPIFYFDTEGRLENLNHMAAHLFAADSLPGGHYYGHREYDLPAVSDGKGSDDTGLAETGPVEAAPNETRSDGVEPDGGGETRAGADARLDGDIRPLLWPDAAFLANLRSGDGPISGKSRDLPTRLGRRRFDIRIKTMLDVSGKFDGSVVTLTDVTDRARAEVAVRSSDEKFRAMFQQTSAGMARLDAEGRFLESNDRFAALVGRNKTALASTPLIDLLHADDRAAMAEKIALVAGGGTDGRVAEIQVPIPDGKTVWLALTLSPVESVDGRPRWCGCVVQDITASKEVERAQRQLSRAVEQSPALILILITDPEGRIEYVNRSFETVTGYFLDEIRGMLPNFLKSGETPLATYVELWRTILSGREWSGRLHNRKKDGSLFWVRVLISPLKDKTGEVVNYIGLQEDITRRVEAETRLTQYRKIDALGNLAGGIAHDFNNMLQPILVLTNLVQQSMDPDDPNRRRLERVVKAADRARWLVARILDFARESEPESVALDIETLVTETVPLLQSVLPATIDIKTDLQPYAGRVEGDATQLLTVLMNLGANARDALENRHGTITITLDGLQVEKEASVLMPHMVPGS